MLDKLLLSWDKKLLRSATTSGWPQFGRAEKERASTECRGSKAKRVMTMVPLGVKVKYPDVLKFPNPAR